MVLASVRGRHRLGRGSHRLEHGAAGAGRAADHRLRDVAGLRPGRVAAAGPDHFDAPPLIRSRGRGAAHGTHGAGGRGGRRGQPLPPRRHGVATFRRRGGAGGAIEAVALARRGGQGQRRRSSARGAAGGRSPARAGAHALLAVGAGSLPGTCRLRDLVEYLSLAPAVDRRVGRPDRGCDRARPACEPGAGGGDPLAGRDLAPPRRRARLFRARGDAGAAQPGQSARARVTGSAGLPGGSSAARGRAGAGGRRARDSGPRCRRRRRSSRGRVRRAAGIPPVGPPAARGSSRPASPTTARSPLPRRRATAWRRSPPSTPRMAGS